MITKNSEEEESFKVLFDYKVIIFWLDFGLLHIYSLCKYKHMQNISCLYISRMYHFI